MLSIEAEKGWGYFWDYTVQAKEQQTNTFYLPGQRSSLCATQHMNKSSVFNFGIENSVDAQPVCVCAHMDGKA